jgi:hypothetical protein
MTTRSLVPFLLALGVGAATLGGLRELSAQTPSTTASAIASAGLPTANVRDFEAEPPTKFGTELDVEADWDEAPRPFLLRPRLTQMHRGWDEFVTLENCDIRVLDDWLKLRCKGRAGRVNQVAGDPNDTVVHISHRHHRDDKGRIVDDQRRLLLFTRLVRGRVSAFELSHVSSQYSGDWESFDAVLTVDWADPDRGPRIMIHRMLPSYAL